jgi:hypothetical protein
VQEIVEDQLDRSELRQRRAELEDPDSGDSDTREGSPRKPFFVRFRNPERSFSVSLSFRTEHQPEPKQVLEALREIVRELESELDEKGNNDHAES